MESVELIQPGMRREQVYCVGEDQTALHIGSGSARVLATPWMIAYMERTARDLLAEYLPAGYSSVGVWVNVRHLAPTPVGGNVQTIVEVSEVDGTRVTFHVSARDEQEIVGEGLHQRIVIEEARFLRRVKAKQAA